MHQELKRKVGRPLAIESAAVLETEANAYFEWCENNPFEDDDFVGKDATKVTRKRRRPFTIIGLCTWLGISHDVFGTYRERAEFREVAHNIVNKIQTQQLEGAAANHFNSNIVARLLGLTDNVNNNTNVAHAVAPEVLSEIASLLRSKSE